MEKGIAILTERQVLDSSKEIFVPKKVIELKDTENLIGIDDIKYYSVFDENATDNYIFFLLNEEALNLLYGDEDINILKEKYFNDSKKYSILKNNETLQVLYSAENKSEIVTMEEFVNHFMANIGNNEEIDFDSKSLYDLLKKNVFEQDEAIKKILVALSFHYADVDNMQKVNIIIDGDKGTGKTTIVNCLKEKMPVSVIVEDLGDENFSFDYLFLSLYNDKNISECPILVLDNAEKLLLNKDLEVADQSINIVKNLMLGKDYMLQISSGVESYPTKDFVIILMGDFKKRLRCGINNYVEGVPEKLSRLTNYNIKMNPMTKELVYAKLMNEENGTFRHYANYIVGSGIKVNANTKLIEKIVNEVMKTNMHELDKVVEKCFEEVLFEIYTTDKSYQELTIDEKVLKNSKKYKLK